MEDIVFSSLSGDVPKHAIFWVDRPTSLWRRIKRHFTHFGEPYRAQIVAMVTFDE